MKTSTEIASLSRIVGEEKAVEELGKAGFDAWDLSLFGMVKWDKVNLCVRETGYPFQGAECLKLIRRLKRIGEDYGMFCNQSHAPYPSEPKEIRDYFKRSIEYTAEAGGAVCVVHPIKKYTAEQNAEMFWEILPFAIDHGVKIATENMYDWSPEHTCAIPAACWSPEDFMKHIKAVDSEWFGACVDIGHASMMGPEISGAAMIEYLGSKVFALHIHDTDLIHDSHMVPFTMKIDYAPVVKALKSIGYSGCMTLESDAYLKTLDESRILEGVEKMAAAARRLAEMYEAEQ